VKRILSIPALALAACGAPSVQAVPGGAVPVRVTSATGQPYTYADGAQAKAQADAQCGTGGVRTTIQDRFDDATATWVFPGGCA
jgi:uncharacterized protein YjbJ (UPF0337 family)